MAPYSGGLYSVRCVVLAYPICAPGLEFGGLAVKAQSRLRALQGQLGEEVQREAQTEVAEALAQVPLTETCCSPA